MGIEDLLKKKEIFHIFYDKALDSLSKKCTFCENWLKNSAVVIRLE